MRGAHALLALATAILCVPLEAAAQEAQPPPGASSPVGNVGTRLYLHGGLNSRVLPEGLANHRVSPPLAGWAHDWFAAVGRFVSPNVSLEGEVVAGGTVSAPQRFSYLQSSDYTAEVRDIWLVANVRARGAAHLELLVGGGIALSTLAKRSVIASRQGPGGLSTETFPDQVDTHRKPMFVGGVDVPFRAGHRVEVLPGMRLRWTGRPREGDADTPTHLGVSTWAFQFGGALRFRLSD